jgi:GNAT superfamily N-acetyltransferase
MSGQPHAKCDFVDVRTQDQTFIAKLAELSYEAFREHAPNWLADIDAALEEVRESCGPRRLSRALLDNDAGEPVGWIGVIPQSGGRVWEIHPVAVRASHQRRGHGRLLVQHVERLAESRGVLTLFAGTSDQTGATSLSAVDLYERLPSALASLSCHKPHPYRFWLSLGFHVVGVMPDADGWGKPGIYMAKRVGQSRRRG